MSEKFEDELSEKSPEKLRELRDYYRNELGWEGNADMVAEELKSRGEPSDANSEVVDDEVATLKEKLDWFRQQGWEANAEKVAEELSRRNELDSEEELGDSTDLTSVAEFSSHPDLHEDPDDGIPEYIASLNPIQLERLYGIVSEEMKKIHD